MSNKIALIIVGDLFRLKKDKDFSKSIDKISKYDKFISTFTSSKAEKHTKNIKNIKYLNIEPDEEINNKKYFTNCYGKNKSLKKSNTRVKYHLDHILKKNKKELLEYDIIMFLRLETYFENFEILETTEIQDNVIYMWSDQLFYGKPDYFLKVFSDFFDLTLKEYIGKTLYTHEELNQTYLQNSEFVGGTNPVRLTETKSISLMGKEEGKDYFHEASFLHHCLRYGPIKGIHFRTVKATHPVPRSNIFNCCTYNKNRAKLIMEYKDQDKYLECCEKLCNIKNFENYKFQKGMSHLIK
tara:strand:- start:24797 stop:25687 length:891 start_codon:yes stop_codon:yes gene_type:complete